MKPRAAWPVLAKKAKEKCDEAFVALKQARERVKHLEQSRERMQMLLADYVVKSKAAESRPHSMSETLNFRAFMQQRSRHLCYFSVPLPRSTSVCPFSPHARPPHFLLS